jgi:hypothetical protein
MQATARKTRILMAKSFAIQPRLGQVDFRTVDFDFNVVSFTISRSRVD